MDKGSSWAVAYCTTATTSLALAQRAIIAGVRTIMAFQIARAESKHG